MALLFKVLLEDTTGGTMVVDPVYHELEPVTAYQCPDCEEICGEHIAGPLYECGECSARFTRANSADGSSNRCPDCNGMARKELDADAIICAACEHYEAEEVRAVECCETFYAYSDDAEPLYRHLIDEHSAL